MADRMDLDSRARLTRAGAIATITLDRPESYNVIDRAMAARLRDLAIDVAGDPEIRALIVRGAGPAFCGGGDIRYFVSNLDAIGDSIRHLLDAYHAFLELLVEMPKLTIASVHGAAAGAGLSLAAMCDFCVVSDDARFTPAYAKLGVSPDGGGTYGLARAVGPRRALQILLGESSFSATQALEWGLAARVFPAADLEAETLAYAEKLVRTSPEAIANTKRLLRVSSQAGLHDHLIDEMESLIRCMDTPMFEQAIDAFVKKA